MTIKLVRTDAEDPCKIQLPLGEHIIGRGKLLECDDKRISRHHGNLKVSDDSLTITSLHQNPCFYTKKGVKETEILRQNNTITLCHGDQFGLLPDAYWYEVIFCSNLETLNINSEKNTEEYSVGNNDTTSDETNNGDKAKGCDFNSDDGFDNQIAELQTLVDAENNEQPQADVSGTQNSTENVLDKTSELNTEDELNLLNSPSVLDQPNEPNEQNVIVQNNPNIKSEPDDQDDPNSLNESSSNKRSHSPDNSEVKKIKTEPGTVKTEKEDDVKPGPSMDQGPVPQPQAANAADANNAAPNRPLRERCMYGASCYRKNPQHLAQFSHPRDADWGPGERGVCPYGNSCVKTDPRHWRDHDHPPGKLPAPSPGQKKRRQRRDSGSPPPAQNLIVGGKRVRRTVARQNQDQDWSDEDEPDPYGTDEEDEWQPDSAPSQDYSEDYL